MSDKLLLSISIPTYNRERQLKELVKSLLAFDKEDIEIVITDNCSTDGTIEMLKDINDRRIKVFKNEKAVPGYYNMILGLFNCKGKYVLHCNDRDIIYNKGLTKLIAFLNKRDYSYVQTTRSYPEPTFNSKIYSKGYESLFNQNYSCHPTGMVFNKELMSKYLFKERYLNYVDDTFTYCFLMRDLLIYGDSAMYECGCWNERHSSIKLELKSGSIYKGGLYFEPDRIVVFVKSVINHICNNDYFRLNQSQKNNLILNIIKFFKKHLVYKKVCYADKRECSHYGINKKHIGYIQFKESYKYYLNECDSIISILNLDENFINDWKILKENIEKNVLNDYISAEKGILYKKIKRITDKDYPY